MWLWFGPFASFPKRFVNRSTQLEGNIWLISSRHPILVVINSTHMRQRCHRARILMKNKQMRRARNDSEKLSAALLFATQSTSALLYIMSVENVICNLATIVAFTMHCAQKQRHTSWEQPMWVARKEALNPLWEKTARAPTDQCTRLDERLSQFSATTHEWNALWLDMIFMDRGLLKQK